MKLADKIKNKKSKGAFTLVELVIVIAVLGILAAIAIPVITTTINSTKISTLESDSATVEMLLKEAVNTSKAGLDVIEYNGKKLSTATVADVMLQNEIDLSIFDIQKIGDAEYAISWNNLSQGTVIISGTDIEPYDIETKIRELE